MRRLQKKKKSAAASIYHCRLLHSQEEILAGVTGLQGEKPGNKEVQCCIGAAGRRV